jgi:hypothetical protein
VYPNPTNGIINISLITEQENGSYEMVISDITGKQVYNALTGKQTILDLNQLGLKSGLYFLRFSSQYYNGRVRIIFVK